MISALRPDTFKKFQLNAGAFLTGFEYSTYNDAGTLKAAVVAAIKAGTNVLSATLGGGSFVAAPQMRSIEVDGKHYDFKGSKVNDGWDIKLTTTMKEVTKNTFSTALALADVEDSGQKHTIKLRTDIKDSDYIPSLVWVGDTSEGLMLIDLKNAMNVTGANFTFVDKGEGTLPVEFHAHQDSVEDMEFAPVTIIFFDPAA